MHRFTLASFIAVGAVLAAVAVPTAAVAYWSASASTGFSLTRANADLTLTSASAAVSLNGASGSGTDYITVDITNTGNVTASSLAISVTETNSSQSFVPTTKSAITTNTVPCSQLSFTASGTMQSAENVLPNQVTRYCIKLDVANVTSTSNGQTAMYTITATGLSSPLTANASTTVVATLTGAPTPVAPSSSITCGSGYATAFSWPTASSNSDPNSLVVTSTANIAVVPVVFSIPPNNTPQMAIASFFTAALTDPLGAGTHTLQFTHDGTDIGQSTITLTNTDGTWSVACVG